MARADIYHAIKAALDALDSKDARREFMEGLPEWKKREYDLEKSRLECLHPSHNEGTAKRARERMARVDAMPRELRHVVYEFGLDVVQEFLNHKVTNPKSIRHLIATVLALDFPDGSNRFNKNSLRHRGMNILDVLAKEDHDDTTYTVVKKP